MGSLSDLFRKYHYLIENAFDLDEAGNLIEKDPAKVIESDELFHDLFMDRMSGVLKELAYDREHEFERPGVRDPGNSMLPPWLFSPFTSTTNTSRPPTTRFVPRQTATQGVPNTGTSQTREPQTAVPGQPGRIGRAGREEQLSQQYATPYQGKIDPNTDYSNARTGDSRLYQGVYQGFRNAGLSHNGAMSQAAEVQRENAYNPDLMFGSHSDPHNSATNAGIMSWQGDRHTALMQKLGAQGLLDKNGGMSRNQATLDAQTAHWVSEMSPEHKAYMSDPNTNFDKNTATVMNGNLIKWRIDDPKYRTGGLKNIDLGYNRLQKAVGNPDSQTAQAATPAPGGSRLTTSGDTSRLNPVLLNTMHAASTHLPDGYSAELTSGSRPGSHVGGGGGLSQHSNGNAMDVQIRGPDGKVIANRGTDTTGMYGLLARAAHHELSQSNPEMAGKLAWGGNFGVARGSNVADLMHYDLGGDRGQLAGMGSTPLANQVAQNSKTDNFIKSTQTAAATPQTPQASAQQQVAAQQQAAARPPGSAPYSDVVGGRNSATVLAQLQKLKPEELNGQHVVLSPGVSNDKHSGDYSNVQQQFAYLKNAGAKVSVVGMGSNYGQENPVVQKMAQDSGFHYIPAGNNDGVHMSPSGYSGVLNQAISTNGAPTHIIGDSLGVGVNSAMNRLPPQKTQMAAATPPPTTPPQPTPATTPSQSTSATPSTQVKYISNDVPSPAPQAAAVAPVSNQSQTVTPVSNQLKTTQTSSARKSLRPGDTRLNEKRQRTAIGLLRSL